MLAQELDDAFAQAVLRGRAYPYAMIDKLGNARGAQLHGGRKLGLCLADIGQHAFELERGCVQFHRPSLGDTQLVRGDGLDGLQRIA